MEQEVRHFCLGFCWLWFVLFLGSVSTSVTDPTCACQNLGSCDFKIQEKESNFSKKQNVALGKPAKMSSQFNNSKYNETSGPPCLAVNGNPNTTFRPINQYPDSSNCIHTGDDDRQPYWEVDLGEPYAISSISIYWRNSHLVRGDGVNLTVDGQLCHVFQTPASDLSQTTCDTQLTGQTIRLSKNDNKTKYDYFITVCEVEVWVCWPGYFGRDCTQVCPRPWCGNNHICNPVDGRCPKGCTKGSYGTKCMETCGLCKEGKSCNQSTGFCDNGCESGLKAPFCNETVEHFCSSTHEVTRLALLVAGSVLGGCLVIGISIAAGLWLRRPRHLLHGEDLKTKLQGDDVIMTPAFTSSTHLAPSLDIAESSGGQCPHPGGECPDYININEIRPTLVPQRKGNTYKPFPTHRPQHKTTSDLETSSSENEEYEEVI